MFAAHEVICHELEISWDIICDRVSNLMNFFLILTRKKPETCRCKKCPLLERKREREKAKQSKADKSTRFSFDWPVVYANPTCKIWKNSCSGWSSVQTSCRPVHHFVTYGTFIKYVRSSLKLEFQCGSIQLASVLHFHFFELLIVYRIWSTMKLQQCEFKCLLKKKSVVGKKTLHCDSRCKNCFGISWIPLRSPSGFGFLTACCGYPWLPLGFPGDPQHTR